MSSPNFVPELASRLARIICPHCRCPIDPLTLEIAASNQAQYRICPECDEAIVCTLSNDGDTRPASRRESQLAQEPA